MNTTNTLMSTAMVPLIIGVIHVLKSSGLPSRFAPLAALAIGTGASLLCAWQTASPGRPVAWAQAITLGLTWGLAAVGLYESGSTARQALNGSGNPYEPPPANWPRAGKTEEV
jgi:hypothetical protein